MMSVQAYNYIETQQAKRSSRSYHPYSIDYYDPSRKSHPGQPQMTSYIQGDYQQQQQQQQTYQGTLCKLDTNHSASARERDRTNNVNSAFLMLRTLIPTDPVDRKLSKIETLRLASSYISHLQTVLTVGLDPSQQPCMKREKYMRRMMGKTEEAPSAICTFCLSEAKGTKCAGGCINGGERCGNSRKQGSSARNTAVEETGGTCVAVIDKGQMSYREFPY